MCHKPKNCVNGLSTKLLQRYGKGTIDAFKNPSLRFEYSPNPYFGWIFDCLKDFWKVFGRFNRE